MDATSSDRDDAGLRLRMMMRLRGAWLPESLTGQPARDAAQAVKRCLTCPRVALCDELLASGRAEGYGLFCPNTHYIEHLRNRTLQFAPGSE